MSIPLLFIIHRQLRREILAIYLRYRLSQLDLKYAREDYYYCHGQSNYTQEKFIEKFLLTTLVYPKLQAKNWTTSCASKNLYHKVPFAEPRPIHWPIFWYNREILGKQAPNSMLYSIRMIYGLSFQTRGKWNVAVLNFKSNVNKIKLPETSRQA